MVRLRLVGIRFAICLLLFMLVPAAAQAEWREGERVILSLSELMPLLGAAAHTDLPGDTPVLLPLDADLSDVRTLRSALIDCGLAGKERGGGLELFRQSRGAKERAANRDLAIFPVAPRSADGIAAGGALLYGRIVEPPFVVEATVDEVRLNGVTVFPAPGERVEAVTAPAGDDRTKSSARAARETYLREKETLGAEAARAHFRETVMARPDYVESEWAGDNALRVKLERGFWKTIVLESEIRPTEDPDDETKLAVHEMLAADLRRALRADVTVVAGATYLIVEDGLGAPALRERLREILLSPEPEDLRLARLQARLGYRDPAADLLYAAERGGAR